MKTRITDEQRITRHIAVTPDGCWIWLGALDKDGYGKMTIPGPDGWEKRRYVRSHRYAYEHFIGPIPEGLELDHFFCDRPSCVNPQHVRPTAARENILRGAGVAAVNLAKRFCPRGHEYDAVRNGQRVCRTCQSITYHERKRR